MNRIFLGAIAAVMIFSACTTLSVQPIQGPDGTTNQLITCSVITDCYSKASEICSGKYKIVNSSGDTYTSGGVDTLVTSSSVTHLLVECVKSP